MVSLVLIIEDGDIMKLRGTEAVINLGALEAASLAHWTIDPLDADQEDSDHTFSAKVISINERRIAEEGRLSLHLFVGANEYVFRAFAVMMADSQDVELIISGQPEVQKRV